jgi:phospholipase C
MLPAMTMKRRDALKTIGALGASAGMAKLLPGCGDGGGGDPPDMRGPAPATTVVLMMENRSFDHQLGARAMLEGKPGDGLVAGMTNMRLDGTPVGLSPATFGTSCVVDPPHGWGAYDTQFNAGANDGFVRAHEEAHNGMFFSEPMQYQTRDQIPATWALADAYTICDRWFASVRGPTWPNRMYWHSGTSNGITSNQLPTGGFSWDTIYHRLEARGVQYAYYYGDIPVIAVIDTIDPTPYIHPFDQFLQDAANGTLPPVVYIDPAFGGNDDHPPHHLMFGQALIAAIYTALATGPHWQNCTFVITYDECGGFFDHVPPPMTADDHAAAGFDRMGFRVPAQVIGPYAKQAYVSSVVYDHTSVLKHFEVKHGLAPLTMRSTAANDILDTIDLDRQAAGTFAEPITLPPIELDYEAIEAACMGVGKPDHPVLEWADRYPERVAKWDRRGKTIELLEDIFWYLDKHNVGRLVGTKKY